MTPLYDHGPVRESAVKIDRPPPVAKRKYTPSEERWMMDGSWVLVQVPEQGRGLEKADTKDAIETKRKTSFARPAVGVAFMAYDLEEALTTLLRRGERDGFGWRKHKIA